MEPKKWTEMTDAEKQATAATVAAGFRQFLAEHQDWDVATKERMLIGLANVHGRRGEAEITDALLELLESERSK